jgi:hypothetical protein
VDWAVDLANGNPFFLVELSGHCRAHHSGESPPQSLQIALDQKVEGLSPDARLVLQSCAMLGGHSTLGRLEAMLGMAPHLTARALSELERGGLIAFREGRVVCRHDLIADAVLRSVTASLGGYLHRRCADLLTEELRNSPSASLAWECARHWDVAEEPTRAWELTVSIVDQLLALGLPKEAVDLCGRAERYCRSREQHAERLLRLSRAHRLLYDWEQVVNSLVERRALLVGARVSARRYSDDEIALFEARWWRNYDGQIMRPAIKRVLDGRAPTLHRLQMAVLVLIVADNEHRRFDAERIAGVIESLETRSPREDVEKSKARLIYHTGFGSLDQAVADGTRLIEAERRSRNSAGLLRALRWISVPLRRTNDIQGAVCAVKEAYEQAASLGLRGEMWNAAFYLENVALDCENLELALEWAPVVVGLDAHVTINGLRGSVHSYTQARIEFMRGDYARARHYVDQLVDFKRTTPASRGEQSILALDILLRVRSGERHIPRAMLKRLVSLHLKTRDAGVDDFETAAVVAGLLHSGNRTEARSIFEYYMRIRRSRIDNHATLQSVELALSR